MSNSETEKKQVIELANYIKTLVPPGVTNLLASRAFAMLLADAAFSITNSDDDITFTAAKGIFECYYKMMANGQISTVNND